MLHLLFAAFLFSSLYFSPFLYLLSFHSSSRASSIPFLLLSFLYCFLCCICSLLPFFFVSLCSFVFLSILLPSFLCFLASFLFYFLLSQLYFPLVIHSLNLALWYISRLSFPFFLFCLLAFLALILCFSSLLFILSFFACFLVFLYFFLFPYFFIS